MGASGGTEDKGFGREGPPAASRTTPGQMLAARITCILGALLMGLGALASYRSIHQVVQTVGRDTVPSILAAERIRATLGDARGVAMNALAAGEGEGGPSMGRFRQDMDQAHRDLLAATRNITYGDEEARTLLVMMCRLAEYEHLLGRAGGQGRREALDSLRAADAVMRTAILPAASELDALNLRYLNGAFQAHHARAGLGLVPFLLGAGLALASLAAAQVLLARRTRRVLNPALACATLLALGFTILGTASLRRIEARLVAIKQEAFDPVHALWKVRALASDANADETLHILFQGRASAATDVLAVRDRIPGLLDAVHAHATHPGEGEAAARLRKAWESYQSIDDGVLELLRRGRFQEAVALDQGRGPREALGAFDRFDEALGTVLRIDQDAFDLGVAEAFAALGTFRTTLGLVTLALVLAAALGFKPRLDEYRF